MSCSCTRGSGRDSQYLVIGYFREDRQELLAHVSVSTHLSLFPPYSAVMLRMQCWEEEDGPTDVVELEHVDVVAVDMYPALVRIASPCLAA